MVCVASDRGHMPVARCRAIQGRRRVDARGALHRTVQVPRRAVTGCVLHSCVHRCVHHEQTPVAACTDGRPHVPRSCARAPWPLAHRPLASANAVARVDSWRRNHGAFARAHPASPGGARRHARVCGMGYAARAPGHSRNNPVGPAWPHALTPPCIHALAWPRVRALAHYCGAAHPTCAHQPAVRVLTGSWVAAHSLSTLT